MNIIQYFLTFISLVHCDAARILAFLTMPSLSHHLTFRPLTEELVKRGHEVVVVTTDPAYPAGKTPENLTEVDLHDISYKTYIKIFSKNIKGQNNVYVQCTSLIDALMQVFEVQYRSDVVQKLLKDDKKFDVVITESTYRITVLLGHVLKAPVILLSSFGFGVTNAETMGAPVHLMYPSVLRQRVKNLTLIEQITETYKEVYLTKLIYAHEEVENALIEKVEPGSPTMSELFENSNLFLVNAHPIWESNRPVPPGIVFLGVVFQKTNTVLPQDLKKLLDNSKNGVIYISFGTTVQERQLPIEKIQIFIKVFSELPYDVIWKWNSADKPQAPEKIQFVKWVPQPDLLKHPNLKLFITHGGIHSTYESIMFGVPFITIPMHLDQYFNADHCVQHGVTKKLNFETITEDILKDSITTIVTDNRYRKNMAKLNTWLHDQPQPPLEKAAMWIEYAIRNNGTRHIRAPAANMPWKQYFLFFFFFYCLLAAALNVNINVVPCQKNVNNDESKAIVEADDTQSTAELAAALNVNINVVPCQKNVNNDESKAIVEADDTQSTSE
ncbi:UDP-glucuronosyltransferase 2B4-like [Bombyx mandarina]|uniref:UDP-glucuronosyltransferase 2B4-like n=1 Tax=Bombyx mandarina TaxID=7092 RepID=A0A6J2JZJ2_BOMMA|nr:UDP-glucuronosyltransferase 2B4-like [Bombyx mandarina]